MKDNIKSELEYEPYPDEASICIICNSRRKIVSFNALAKKHFPFLSLSEDIQTALRVTLKIGISSFELYDKRWIVSVSFKDGLYKLKLFPLEIGETADRNTPALPFKEGLEPSARNTLLESDAEGSLKGLASEKRVAVAVKDLLEALRRRTEKSLSRWGYRLEVLCESKLAVASDHTRLAAAMLWAICFLLVNTDRKRLTCRVLEKADNAIVVLSCECKELKLYKNTPGAVDTAAICLEKISRLCNKDISFSSPQYRSGRVEISFLLKCSNEKALYTLRAPQDVISDERLSDVLFALKSILEHNKKSADTLLNTML